MTDTPYMSLTREQADVLRGELDTLRARVAELEAELAITQKYADDCGSLLTRATTERDAAYSHAATLREALVKAHVELCDDVDGGCAANGRACFIAAVLAQPPAASLAAVRASVWEAAAAKCDEREEIYQGEAEACESNGEEAEGFESLRDECAGLANVFRALAAQEVKP